jgi:hypothetical protein
MAHAVKMDIRCPKKNGDPGFTIELQKRTTNKIMGDA